MKVQAEWKKVVLPSAFAALALAFNLSGCGKSSEDQPVPGAAPGPIAPPPPGYGGYPITNCIPVDQPISFNATNIYVDTASLRFGPASNVGQVVMTVGNIAGQYNARGVDGNLSMNFTTPTGYNPYQNPYNYYPYPVNPNPAQPVVVGNASANGTLTLSPMSRDEIRWVMGPSACASSISMDLGWVNPQLSGGGYGTPYVFGDIILQLQGGANGQSQTYRINVTRPY